MTDALLTDVIATATLLIGVFLGGFVSGLSGFAFSAAAGAVLLHVLPHVVAVPLMILCSLLNQAFSMATLRACMEWRASLAMIAGGLIGIPAGLLALHTLDAKTFRAGFGLFLAGYATYMLLRPAPLRLTPATVSRSAIIGLAGGVVGGLTAMPGALPTIWYDLQGLSKERKRGLTQPFIFSMQAVAVATLLSAGSLDAQVLRLTAAAVPAVLLGTALGVSLFGKLNEANFRRAVLVLLLASGCAMAAKAF